MNKLLNYSAKSAGTVLAGTAVIGGLILLSALPFSGHLELDAVPVDSVLLAELADLQDQVIDPENPKRLHVDVDYRLGEAASWFPKAQSPVLDDLVRSGALPPVAERVGPEPLVLRGVEGPGSYGGDLFRLNDIGGWRMQPVTLVRWSPQGYPLVPNVAKSWEVSEGGRVYTFTLRRGMRWSDGEPFTSADILYWWENEQLDPEVNSGLPIREMMHRGQTATVEAPDPLTVRISFESPNNLFLEELAGNPSPCQSPRHYMKQFHPVHGDPDLIRRVQQQHNLINPKAVYGFARTRIEKPTLDPWLIRTERTTSPIVHVRNPFYWAVDENGKQLPYLDRIVVNEKSMDMLTISAAQGEVSMQARYIRNQDYILLMNQRLRYGYQVHHFINGDGSDWGISFNLNRRREAGNPALDHRADLLADKRFRQALSLAVDRQTIVDAMFPGMTRPHQTGPVPPSPYAFDTLEDPFVRFDPEKANALLDAIGLTGRDPDGYRCFPGGPPLLFDINYSGFSGEGPGEFIVDDWRRVGIRARLRPQDRSIFYVEKSAGLHDMSVWGGYGAFLPLLDPRYYFPFSNESNFAVRHGRWYQAGGLFTDADARIRGDAPPPDSPMRLAMERYEELKMSESPERQKERFREILELATEKVYVLNFYTPLPQLAVVKNGFRNVPRRGVYSWPFLSPSNMGPETWFWDNHTPSKRELAEISRELSRLQPIRPLAGGEQPVAGEPAAQTVPDAFRRIAGGLIKWGLRLAGILLLILVALRSPFVARRLLMMIPTLFVISVISFMVIELPAGDAITSKIVEMQEQGGSVDEGLIQDMKEMFRTEEPAWRRYVWWMGLEWFSSFDARDEGLLQGNMGRSMLDLMPVNQKVGDRLLFTFLISLGTILFTWILALPIGIYSAVKQYTFFDYVFTIGGFIGMCIPGFLLALLMMFASEALFGFTVSGLFSPEYAVQTAWSPGKVLDLLKHIWLPILVMGITGTAGMIRVMRANLLDELKKPYVVTARAKGVRPLTLLLKYPVRVALNPFISGIGGILPELISGGAIVSIVMSLPTIGPMQLDAVMQQDMYLAGSMLMLLSTLAVIGTLLSDLLLMTVDPRIRLQGGARS